MRGCSCYPLLFPFKQSFSPEYYCNSLKTLETALDQVPVYRSWRVFDLKKEYPIDVRYAVMPALTKKDIRNNFPKGLIPSDNDISQGLTSGEVEFVKTSGTTDDSVTNIWNQKWWNASEKASWKLNSYMAKVATGNHLEAILVNPLNVGFVSDDSPLPMEKRRLSRFLYLNEKTDPLSWTSEHMGRMIMELEIFKPVVLEANPSLLAKLCRYIVTAGKVVFQPKLIVLTYENPTHFHYQQIHRVFGIPIASSYGSTETGYVFMQCEEGKFHQNTEYCRVDFQPLKPEHGGPQLGRILVTTFNNPWYFIVHYDVGDLVRIDEEGSCHCGRDSGIILSAIEGRVRDISLTYKGKLVTSMELDNALSILTGIDEYQLYQTARDVYRLHLVSQRKDKRKLSEEAEGVLHKLYGEEPKVSIIYEKAISPETSGKYRISGTLFSVNIEEYLDERYVCKRG